MNATIKKVINDQCGFITAEDVANLTPDFANMEVLVRTNMNRCVCRMDALQTAFKDVEVKGDSVRDVSLTSKNFDCIKNSDNYLVGPDKISWKY